MVDKSEEKSACTDDKVFATLKVFNVDNKRIEKNFILRKGRTVLGRNHDQCDLYLPFNNLSKQHCVILIDNDEHFIMDLDSRNKTYRRTHRLIPNVYYELTNEIKLTLADVECYYHIGEVTDESSPTTTTTTVDDVPHSMNSDTPTTHYTTAHSMNETKEIRHNDNDDDGSSTSTRTPSPLLDSVNGGSVLDRQQEQHVHYDLPPQEDGEDGVECCSPPLLAQTGDTTASPLFDGNGVKDSIIEDDDNDQTLPFDAVLDLPCDSTTTTHRDSMEHEEKPTTDKMDTEELADALPMGGVIEPTIAYQMDPEDSESVPTMGGVIEPTVAYQMDTDSESGGVPPMGGVIEPTVAYELEEDMSSKEMEHNIESNEPADKREAESSPDKVKEDVKEIIKENDINPSTVAMDTAEGHEEVKPTRKAAQKRSMKKKVTVSARGRGRGKPTTDSALDQHENEESTAESEDVKSSASATVVKGRGRKRQLVKGIEDDDCSLPSDDSKEVIKSKKTEPGAKRKKIDEVDKPESTVKPSSKLVDLSEESPDIPTLNKTTENDQEVPPVVEDNPQPSVSKGRRGRKRKAPAADILTDKKTATEKEEASAEPNQSTRSNKKSKKKISEPKEIKSNSIEDDNTDLYSESTKENDKEHNNGSGVKKVNVRVKKVKGKIHVGDTDKGNDDTDKDNPDIEEVRVMFTGVSDTEGTEIVQKLGGEMVDSVFQCTHLVTDKVRRTVKFLCCLSRGCTIISTNWLNKCEAEGRFMPCETFVIKDKTNERMYKFTLKESIAKARSSPLLQGWSVFVSPNVKPSPKEMSDIIECAGGQVLKECPCNKPSDNQLIISCEEDLAGIKEAIDNGVTVCTSEVLLTGVLRQQLQTDLYKISNRGSGSKRRR